MVEFSIVIPVHNEEANVAVLVKEIKQRVNAEHTFEILFVDDCSTDETVAKLNEISLITPNLRFICFTKQSGQSSALRAGIKSAKYPLIVTLDGDGQNDPKDIESFLLHFSTDDHTPEVLLINGYRKVRQDTAWRRFSSRIANSIRIFLLNDATPDSGCGIKAFHKQHFLDLPPFNHMHRFLPALILQQGGRVLNVRVNHRSRSHGQSKYGTLDRLFCGIYDVLGVMWLGKRSLKSGALKKESNNG